MPSASEFQLVQVDHISLDESNPRIAYFLEHLPSPHTAEQIFIALGAGSDDESGGMASFNRLKNSIQTNGGIVNPVILRQSGPSDFKCIEGNTRVALYREFRDKGIGGSWGTIPAVIHSALSEADVHAIRLQAHLVGPRAWTPYAKAKYLTYLRNEEHFEFARLVDFCGGNQKSIQEALDAYADMETHYRPHLESDEDFDITRFSGFVELQKPGVKEAIKHAGFALDDFGRWIIDGKIEKLAHVRWLSKVLKDKKATAAFIKSGIEDAIDLTEAPDQTKVLQDASLVSLARALTEALRRIEYREVKKLKDEPMSQTAQYLTEAYEALKEIMADIGAE
jgi:hypothetical protein